MIHQTLKSAEIAAGIIIFVVFTIGLLNAKLKQYEETTFVKLM